MRTFYSCALAFEPFRMLRAADHSSGSPSGMMSRVCCALWHAYSLLVCFALEPFGTVRAADQCSGSQSGVMRLAFEPFGMIRAAGQGSGMMPCFTLSLVDIKELVSCLVSQSNSCMPRPLHTPPRSRTTRHLKSPTRCGFGPCHMLISEDNLLSFYM